MRKRRQNKRKQRVDNIRYLNFKQNAPKEIQTGYLPRKGKPTKGKADAKKVNKQTRKTEKSMQQK